LLRNGGRRLSKADLEEVIRGKLRSSYSYSPKWVDAPRHRLSQFNVIKIAP